MHSMSLIRYKNRSDTVPAAMRCFYESRDYESFMRNIFSLECDSDTFGAIAGGVAEEFYHGFGELDGEKIVKKYLSEELRSILFGEENNDLGMHIEKCRN